MSRRGEGLPNKPSSKSLARQSAFSWSELLPPELCRGLNLLEAGLVEVHLPICPFGPHLEGFRLESGKFHGITSIEFGRRLIGNDGSIGEREFLGECSMS